MPVELTPNGTRGANLPRPLVKVGLVVLNLYTRLRGAPLLTLTTYGSRSGREHSVPLRYSLDPTHPGAWLVVASFGGTARHPAWYVNLARNPERVRVALDGRTAQVRADSLSGAERTQMWNHIVAQAPVYAEYQRKTDREIPIVRLTPVAG
ncbi:MAG: nitroreductase family deazaflavin-dependent oxidoreductase [Chloroflexi bacterium]|nr:nitroreductase family deazaflavin-dependent oxidoreductase [Chloroflexota bacterium]